MGDLWALKGLIEEENESPGWTQLKLPGQAPSPCCGHTFTSGGHYLLLFGGHGTGGWLSRYDIYHNDCVVLDRVSAQWKRLPTTNEPPPARAYHSMNCIGSRYLLFGGFDGKVTYGDLWWLVPEEDPIAKRLSAAPPKFIAENEDRAMANDSLRSAAKESQMDESAISNLQKSLEISISFATPELQIIDESEDREFLELASKVVGGVSRDGQVSNIQCAQALRDHWRKSSPRAIQLKQLNPLLRDYQRLITRHYVEKVGSNLQTTESGFPGKESYRFYHIRNASQLRLDDIPDLLAEYKQLLSVTRTI